MAIGLVGNAAGFATISGESVALAQTVVTEWFSPPRAIDLCRILGAIAALIGLSKLLVSVAASGSLGDASSLTGMLSGR